MVDFLRGGFDRRQTSGYAAETRSPYGWIFHRPTSV